MLLRYPDDAKKALSRGLFEFLADGNSELSLDLVEELFDSWGLPYAHTAAKNNFRKADADDSGHIDFAEFEGSMGYVIDSIWDKGERDVDIKTVRTSKTMRNMKAGPPVAKSVEREEAGLPGALPDAGAPPEARDVEGARAALP